MICLTGDGGLQFTLPELASAVEAHVPVIVMLWNNFDYGEIRKYMNARGIVPVGGHRASMSARHGAHAEISIVARF